MTEDLSGRLIDRYRLVRLVGSGGMGVVYEAVRADAQFDRRVAIKLVTRKSGADSSRLESFRHEIRTLSVLDHPNIVKLIDGGVTEDGLPYLVMDFVQGEPIVSYCLTRQLPVSERLKLFRLLLAAVHYAHQHLVIHRDIKPKNILVTADAEPKLLDFGVARLTREGRVEEEPAKMHSSLTLKYASPEQFRGQPLTVAADIFSLGIVLYEMLTGKFPWTLADPNPMAVAYAICEQPPDEHPALPGDLGLIVRKAVQKDPRNRYASAADFSEDIRRYLVRLPVSAHPQSLVYTVKRWVQRETPLAATFAAIGLMIAIGVAINIRSAIETAVQREHAEKRFQETRELAHSVLFDIFDAVRTLPGSTSAQALIIDRGSRYLERLAKEASGDAGLQIEVAEAWRRLGDVQGNPYEANLGKPEEARKAYEKSLAVSEAVLRDNPKDPAAARSVASSHERLSAITALLGDSGRAIDHIRKGISVLEPLAAANPHDVDLGRTLATCYEQLGDLQGMGVTTSQGNARGALESYQRSLGIVQKLLEANPGHTRLQRAVAVIGSKVGDAQLDLGDAQAASVSYTRANETLQPLIKTEPSNPIYQRLAAFMEQKMAYARGEAGDPAAAIEAYGRACKMIEKLLAGDPENAQYHNDLAGCFRNTAVFQYRAGDAGGVLASYSRAIDEMEKLVASQPGNYAWKGRLTQLFLEAGSSLHEAGQTVEARRMAEKGLAAARQLADRQEATPNEIETYANALVTVEPKELRNGRTAMVYAQRAVEMSKGENAEFLATLAEAQFIAGQPKEALASAEKAMSLNAAPSIKRELERRLAEYRKAGVPAPPQSPPVKK